MRRGVRRSTKLVMLCLTVLVDMLQFQLCVCARFSIGHARADDLTI